LIILPTFPYNKFVVIALGSSYYLFYARLMLKVFIFLTHALSQNNIECVYMRNNVK